MCFEIKNRKREERRLKEKKIKKMKLNYEVNKKEIEKKKQLEKIKKQNKNIQITMMSDWHTTKLSVEEYKEYIRLGIENNEFPVMIEI